MSTEKKAVYLLQYVKQTSMLGEQVTISTNMPGESTEEDMSKEIIKLGNVLDNRMRDMNKTIKRLNGKDGQEGKGFDELGIEPGTLYVPTEE